MANTALVHASQPCLDFFGEHCRPPNLSGHLQAVGVTRASHVLMAIEDVERELIHVLFAGAFSAEG